ncbi:hypothetical protein ACFVVC_01710 [Pseudarthrobacter sp. NPDC058196]|uniref:hypothetical protein n=1 Tax=Pseudarthrobacter sp. NPDC058196 TaxID=3346376 RepID=UPI0036DB9628
MNEKTLPHYTARPYRVFLDVLVVIGPSWNPVVGTSRVVDVGLSDQQIAALSGGADRNGLLRASRLIPLRHPLELAGSVLVALVMVLLGPVVPWLGMLGVALLMLVVLTQLLLCWYIGTHAPGFRRVWEESLADGTLAIVPADDVSGMDLRRIDRALTTLQSRTGTRHDAEALAAVRSVLDRDRAAAEQEPEPETDMVDSMFNSIVTALTVKTPTQLIAELEDRAARR